MKVGLFFGSFNPIHIGHIIIANYMVEFTNLDKVWFIVTPHNPHKKKNTLLDDHHRLEMVYQSIKDNENLAVCDIEFKLPQPSYTSNTLSHLLSKYKKNKFSLIMGQDNLENFHKWKNYEHILENYPLYIYPRISEKKTTKKVTHHNINITQAPIIQISASFIRNAIKQNKNVSSMLTQNTWEYIRHNNFYKK